jgi:hypothetical protein
MKRGQRVIVHHGIGQPAQGVIVRLLADQRAAVKLDSGGSMVFPRHMCAIANPLDLDDHAQGAA